MKKIVLLLLAAGLSVTSCNQSANNNDCSFTVDGVSFKMVYVQGGTFTMGATSEQGSDARSDEKPAHRVTLSDYYIGKYEVTQGQWKAVMRSNPSRFKKEGNYPVEEVSWNDIQKFIWKLNERIGKRLKKGENYPVEEVSWYDIQEFIRKLNERTGKRYALPTEAQWEFAARGGNRAAGTKYSGSADIDEVAWYEHSGNTTHPVGTKSPNELGIYDMSGNVSEWCSDLYDENYYQDSPSTDPVGPSSGSRGVLRGGSWFSDAGSCRVSDRDFPFPNARGDNLGFRLVLLP